MRGVIKLLSVYPAFNHIKRLWINTMKPIPADLIEKYITLLKENTIPEKYHHYYLKWLRFYLDFCHKYKFDESSSQSIPAFIKKLEEKKQTELSKKQAHKAIRIYYESFQTYHQVGENDLPETQVNQTTAKEPQHSFSAADVEYKKQPKVKKLDPPAREASDKNGNEKWKSALEALSNEIKVRHYSPKTLKSYATWVRKVQSFLKSKDPTEMSTEDVKKFLTFLAVDQSVSASSQNQAFNALLFFFRHVLGREFGKMDGVVRAKRRPYIPVVLSRNEINAVTENLEKPYSIVVKLLYGCGLRLFECLNLRIHCFNFDQRILTVHDGKGKKDRSVPLPVRLIPDLNAHLEMVKKLHDKDLVGGYAGATIFMKPMSKRQSNRR